MNEVVWETGLHGMLANGQTEMSSLPPVRHSARSQDDAMVGYFYQRPQTDPDFQSYSKQARWALGDDSVLEGEANILAVGFTLSTVTKWLEQFYRWSGASINMVRGGDTAELESGFQALALETGHQLEQISASTKKLWGVEEPGPKPDDATKGLFLGDQWRDTAWSTGHNAASGVAFAEHAVSQPIMVQRRSGSYPGSDAAAMLSPRSSETGGLGMKMAEYVLGTSPTTKDLDSRISRLHVGMNSVENQEKNKGSKNSPYGGDGKKDDGSGGGMIQANGIIQNGIDDDKSYKMHGRSTGSRQPSPSEEDVNKNVAMNDVHVSKMPKSDMVVQSVQGGPMQQGPNLHGLESGYDPVGIDTLHFDYPSQLMQSMDSPGILDYGSQRTSEPTPPLLSQLYQQQRNQHMQPMLAAAAAAAQQQQYQPHMGPPTQQQGQNMGVPPPPATPYTSSPYMMNQDPYAPMGTIMAGQFGPAVLPQYYGMPPWGVFPAPTPGMMQGGQGQPQNPAAVQQQLMRGGGARPMTPQGPPGPEGMPQGGNSVQGMQGPGGQYQMLPPPYYDQMMGNTRGMGAAMRLVPPVLMNPAAAAGQPTNNPGGALPQYCNMNNGGLRLMGSQGQQVPNAAANMLSSNASNPVGNALYTTAATSNMGYNPVTSGMGFSGNNSNHLGFPSGLGMGLGQTQGNMGYGNSALGPIGSSAMGSLGSGLGGNSGSPRRDSFDRRDSGLGGGPNGPGFSASLDNQFSRHMGPGKGGGYYGPLGTMSASPGPGPIGMLPPSQSLSPPPSLNGSTGNLSLGTISNCMRSAAPGAEAKFMIRNGPLGGGMFGSSNSLFPTRSLQRNSSLEKPTGRSRLLEDFRNNRYPNLQLRDLANHIVEFSQDQHGSRFIQQKLERATPAEKQMVFSEILGAAYSLMTDVFGNYVIQKFFEFGTPEQKQALAQKVKGHVLPLALQMYGCRVIQKALESIPPEQQFVLQKEVVKELDGHVLKCVKDQNGNHVVQKCIECVDPLALQFIINAFQGQVFALSTHPYGCRVIQRILEHCTPEQTLPILEELHQHTEQLVQDQYGNYVVQHVLEHGRSEDKSKIVTQVRGKVLQLSQHKFASNVVEKCVTHSSRAERTVLIEEVCTCHDGALYTMMKDQYANYVVQKMIEVAEPNQRKLLLHKIRPHIASLRKYTYGKHILAKLEKYLVKNNDLGPIGAPPNGSL